jgi:putative SOS response-associated peptidase YedK
MRLNSDTGKRERAGMRWALNPFWNQDAKIGYSTTNASLQTVSRLARCSGKLSSAAAAWFPQIFYERKKLEAKANSRLYGREKEPRPLTARKSFQLTLPHWPCKTHVALPCLTGRFD